MHGCWWQGSVARFQARHNGTHPAVDAHNFEIAEHTSNILFTAGLAAHPMRVWDPEAAEMFVFPTSLISAPDPERFRRLATLLVGEQYFHRRGGHDHVMHTGHWSCNKDEHFYRLAANMTVLTVDNKWCCGGQPDHTVVGPYVPHAEVRCTATASLTRSLHNHRLHRSLSPTLRADTYTMTRMHTF